MGDNGQAWISGNKKEALIDLRGLLDGYQIVKLKNGVTPKDQIVLAVNERMAFIYTLSKEKLPLKQVAEPLQKDGRIDIIAWKNEKDEIEVMPGGEMGGLHLSQGDAQLTNMASHGHVKAIPMCLISPSAKQRLNTENSRMLSQDCTAHVFPMKATI